MNQPAAGNHTGVPDTMGTAQEEDSAPKGIDYDHVEETDSALLNAVYRFQRTFRGNKVDAYAHPTMNPNGVAYADRQDNIFAPYYLSAGQLGHPHYSLWITPWQGDFYPAGFMSFLQPFLFEGYAHESNSIPFYQTLRPYTSLGYGGSLNKDNQLHVTHTQNVTPRWNIALDFDLMRRNGIIARSGVGNTSFGLTSNYYSKDARYQMQAALLSNTII